jgi:thiol-disulfide isomerase/thioredoxin
MKRGLTAAILVLIQHVLFAQSGKLTLNPKLPKSGDELEIIYAEGQIHSNAGPETAVIAQVLSISNHIETQVQNIKMEHSGDKWVAKFHLSTAIVHFLIRFKLKDHIDDNTGEAWRYMIYNADGKPVKDACLARAYISGTGGIKGFSVKKSPENEDIDLKNELANYPHNINAFSYKWSRMMENGKTEEAKKELLTVYNTNKGNAELVKELLPLFDRLHMEDQTILVKNSLIKADPKGELAFRERVKRLMASGNPSFAITEIQALFADFPNMPAGARKMFTEAMVNICVHQMSYEKAVEFIEKYDPESLINYYLIAKPMISKGEKLSLATSLIEKEIDLLRHATSAQVEYAGISKDPFLGNVYYSYALGLQKQGKKTQALLAFDSSYQASRGQNISANEDYLRLLFQETKYDVVVKLSEECLLNNNGNGRITEFYRSANLKLNVPQGDIDLKLNAIGKKVKESTLKSLKNEMLSEAAPEFHLKYPNGNSVKLSDLKGKVVVLDFWATWCQPCIASLPKLQEMHDKYKSNPEVVILAVDKQERGNTLKEREQKMKDFIAENRYSFKALYDNNSVADKYNVDGIPATIFIDRNGVIRFKEHGLEKQAFGEHVDFLLEKK